MLVDTSCCGFFCPFLFPYTSNMQISPLISQFKVVPDEKEQNPEPKKH